MEKLSLKKYAWRCVLGGEVVYFICLLGGYLPLRFTSRAVELHETFFEMLPGFIWGSVGSIILGAVYVFVFSWIFGWYMVWMHNSSLEK